MNTRKGYGTKIYDIHLKVGQKTRDKLDQVQEEYGIPQSKAIRWAVLNADFGGYGSSNNADRGTAPVADDATGLAVQRYDQEELLTMQAALKVLKGYRTDFHRIGGNLNQIAHGMNSARLEGNHYVTKDDVISTRELRKEIREKYKDISSLISFLEELCNKQ